MLTVQHRLLYLGKRAYFSRDVYYIMYITHTLYIHTIILLNIMRRTMFPL